MVPPARIPRPGPSYWITPPSAEPVGALTIIALAIVPPPESTNRLADPVIVTRPLPSASVAAATSVPPRNEVAPV